MKRIIGIVSSHYLPYIGGVERYTLNLAKHLHKLGYRVIIITSHHNGCEVIEQLPYAKIYRLPSYMAMEGRMPIIKKNRTFKTIVEELEKEEIEAIIINTRFYAISVWAARWAQKRKIHSVLIEHGTSYIDLQNPFVNVLAHTYEHLLTTWLKLYVKDFYGVSKDCCEWLKCFNIYAVGTLYNAIEKEDYIINPIKNEDEKILITYAGRLVEDKGIRKLCEAIDRLNDNKLELTVIGDGPIFDDIKNKYHNVKWLGSLPHESVIKMLYDTDIFVLPTDYPEGFPTSVLEAAASGCYVITTKAGGSKEVISSVEYGCILDNNTIEEIMTSIVRISDNKEFIHHVGLNAREKVLSYYTWDNTVHSVLEALNYE